jgi:UDP-glucose 6-dehydrogenase
MQITAAGVEHAGLVTSAWIKELGQMVTWIDIQKEEIIQNDVIVCSKATLPVCTNDLIQPIIERSKPPNLHLN